MAAPWEKYQRQTGGIYQLPPSPQEAAQTINTQTNTRRTNADIGNDAERLRMERERLRIAREESDLNRRNQAAQADLHEYELEAKRRELESQNPFNPSTLASIQEDAKQKLGVIEDIARNYNESWLPAVGFGSETVSGIGGTNAANLRVKMGELGSAGALRGIMDLSAQNGGKNPLTPMSRSDVDLVAASVAGVDPNKQSAQDFFKSLEPYRRAYTNAYAGAVGMRTLGNVIEQQVAKWKAENPGHTMKQERVFRDTLTRNAKANYDRRMADMRTARSQRNGARTNAPRKGGGAQFLGWED